MFKETIDNLQLRVNPEGTRIHQTDRNKARLALMNELATLFEKNDVECCILKEGIAINVQHEELGSINFIVDVKMKDLTFDFDFEVEQSKLDW